MAHCRITIIGTEEQYDKVYDYLMEKENPGYFEDIRNGMDEISAFYKWGSFNSIGGSDWVKVERLTLLNKNMSISTSQNISDGTTTTAMMNAVIKTIIFLM